MMRARVDALIEKSGRVAAVRGDIATWDDVKLLAVSVDRLTQWSRAGLLCIGDAAHAMSPVGGVVINLAIQDAGATANALAVKLREGGASLPDVPAISGANAGLEPPLPMRLLAAVPPLQRLFARVIGMGVRPERVRSPLAPGWLWRPGRGQRFVRPW